MDLRAEHKRHVENATKNGVKRPMDYMEFIRFKANYYGDLVKWLRSDVPYIEETIERWREEAQKWLAKPSPFHQHMAKKRKKAIKTWTVKLEQRKKMLETHEKILPAYQAEAERLGVG